ncbi:MAG: serine protease [Chloroflexi bacterium]|nr:MAG: serine protease [Chloroflexota bacterium]MBL1196158.1 serine protease [Chloroflexota bacterium]NOH13451.1 trypsin-like peptidase domain-containing protein [Chloroflexota bacterium]
MKAKQLAAFLFVFLLIAILLAACGGAATDVAPAAEEPVIEEPALEEPAAEEPAAEEPMEEEMAEPEAVVYGADSRLEPYDHPDLVLQEYAASVAVLVDFQNISTEGELVSIAGPTLDDLVFSNYNLPLCTQEAYSSQPTAGQCTGFLVGEDLLVTAGHCLELIPCEAMSVVFGYEMAPDGELAPVERDNVYGCQEVVAQQNTPEEDYAILRLDRPAQQTPLPVASQAVNLGDPVAVIGHPSGLPIKIASDANVIQTTGVTQSESGELLSVDSLFVTNLDTFGGNSGSPVINTDTYEVVGILVGGDEDYVQSSEELCVEVNRCDLSGVGCTGESVTKMSYLVAFIFGVEP